MLSIAVAVGHDPDSLSSVRRSNIVGTNNDRPDFVALSLKLIADPSKSVRLERSEAERVLCQDPGGSNLFADAEKFRPEPSNVSRSNPSSCHRSGLARGTSCNKPN